MMKIKRIEPNFFTSQAYLEKSGVTLQGDNACVWLVADSMCVLPPIPCADPPAVCPVDFCWSDFNVLWSDPEMSPEFLDWEYLFNPLSFQNMAGKDWAVFRKNARKWPTRNPGWAYSPCPPLMSYEIWALLGGWLDGKEDSMQDLDLLIRFLEEPAIDFARGYLFNKQRELMAVNIWDWNHQYVNYRFCIVRKDQPFLDEFARLCFYTDPVIKRGALVNDGGCLGSPGLERFKDKLNPIRKRPVNSWRRKTA